MIHMLGKQQIQAVEVYLLTQHVIRLNMSQNSPRIRFCTSYPTNPERFSLTGFMVRFCPKGYPLYM